MQKSIYTKYLDNYGNKLYLKYFLKQQIEALVKPAGRFRNNTAPETSQTSRLYGI